MSEERSIKKVFLAFGNIVAAIAETYEDIEQGAEPFRAMNKSYRKARRRWAALEKAEKRSSEPAPARRFRSEPPSNGGKGGVVIDVTPEVEKRRRWNSR
jgi:hypothetical protein